MENTNENSDITHQLSVVVSSPHSEQMAREIVTKVIQRINRILGLMNKPYRLALKVQKPERSETDNLRNVADQQFTMSDCHIFVAIL